jgi:aspartyl-tRNA(Asn)/glutamyl-tRNA(Gln) amidotransferase subunit C
LCGAKISEYGIRSTEYGISGRSPSVGTGARRLEIPHFVLRIPHFPAALVVFFHAFIQHFSMPLDPNVISKLEKLARLRLEPEARERLGADLERILDFVDRLQKLDTTGVEPLIYLIEPEEATGWRDDATAEHLPREQALENAPDHDGAFFRVPKVIE